MVAEQLQNVRAEIRKACEKSGRNPEEVTLIAVSKTKPVEMLEEAYGIGIRVLMPYDPNTSFLFCHNTLLRKRAPKKKPHPVKILILCMILDNAKSC